VVVVKGRTGTVAAVPLLELDLWVTIDEAEELAAVFGPIIKVKLDQREVIMVNYTKVFS